MAVSRHVFVRSLVMFAIIGLACASNSPRPEDAPISEAASRPLDAKRPDDAIRAKDAHDAVLRPDEDDYLEDDSEFLIGTRAGDAPSPNGVIAAPIGGPVPPGVFQPSPPATASSKSSAVSSLHHLSAITGTAATAAIAGFFYL